MDSKTLCNSIKIVFLGAIMVLLVYRTDVEAGQLRAGIAKTDITPEKPVRMSGYESRKDLSKGVHDRLSARVVAFESGAKRLVLLSTDLIGFYGGTADDFRKIICNKYKLDDGELFLCGIHTHSAPTLTLSKDSVHANNFEYTMRLREELVEVVGNALGSLKPVAIGAGVGYCPIGANRRQLVFDKLGNSEIKLGRNPYGVTDKEVLAMKIVDDSNAVAVIFNYATHATSLGPKNLVISGDVIGLAEQFVENVYGNKLIAPAFAGASGNIDPWYRVLPEFNQREGWIPEPVLLGTFLGEEVVHVCEQIELEKSDVAIKTAFVTLELPGKEEGTVEVATDHSTTKLNVAVAKLGNIAFVGLGGEVLTEIGMAIKEASPFEHTFVITHCNGAAGYLPTRDAYIEGGYEVKSSPFAPPAAEKVVKTAVEMLYDLH
jgi:neutral ceramidase